MQQGTKECNKVDRNEIVKCARLGQMRKGVLMGSELLGLKMMVINIQSEHFFVGKSVEAIEVLETIGELVGEFIGLDIVGELVGTDIVGVITQHWHICVEEVRYLC